MSRTGRRVGATSWVLGVGLGTAALFEVLSLPELEVRSLWRASPWRQDPVHTVVWLAAFMVPMLGLALGLRWLAGWVSGGLRDGAWTAAMFRAAAVLTGAIGLTLVCEWATVPGRTVEGPGAAAGQWQLAGLVTLSVLAVVLIAWLSVLLRRLPRRLRRFGAPDSDGFGDAVLLAGRLPVVRRWATPQAVAWMRRRAMTVFVVLSLLAAAAFTAAQAVGERITDPVFVAWLFVAETAANLAFCVISNALAGFVARPPRSGRRHIAETALVAGCLATVAAIAFHDALWSALGRGPLTAPRLEGLTLGAGLAAALVAAGVTAGLLRTTGRRRQII